MTLTNKEAIEKAHKDPRFRMQFLKELVRMAVREDPDIIKKVIKKICDE